MIISFYKGFKGNISDKAICVWTFGKYSHCELLDNKGYSISASSRDDGVRKKKIPIDLDKWDYFVINLKHPAKFKWLETFYQLTKDSKYDWYGIFLSQILPFGIEDPNKYYCSEWILYFLKHILYLPINIDQASPSRLYRVLKKYDFIRDVRATDLEKMSRKISS